MIGCAPTSHGRHGLPPSRKTVILMGGLPPTLGLSLSPPQGQPRFLSHAFHLLVRDHNWGKTELLSWTGDRALVYLA